MSEAVTSTTLRAAPWGALAVSLVVHLTGFGISAAVVFAPLAASPDRDGIVQADVTPVVSDPDPVILSLGEWQPAPAGGGSPHSFAQSVDAPLEPRLAGFNLDGPAIFGQGDNLSYTDVIPDGGGGGGTGGGSGEGDGTGNGYGSGEGFFGMDLAGERFVFVVDSSRSMNHPYPGEAKNRLGRVKIELYNTIQKMKPNQSFFVVFFNSEPIPMPARGLVRAESTMLQPLMKWIFSARGLGQTNPEPALLMALRLNPDKIYFLTDGAFSYRSVRAVRELNRGRIPIHTIGFGGQGGEKNLQEIARDSQGTYQFIPEPVEEIAPEMPANKAAAIPVAP